MHVLLPPEVQPFAQPPYDRISLQSFGVSHMKFGAGAEGLFRSLSNAQSTTVQVVGLARTIWLQRAGLVLMSW